MSAPRTPKPSPLAGEGGEHRSQVYTACVNLAACEPGEGASSHHSGEANPSPASLARARSALPQGERGSPPRVPGLLVGLYRWRADCARA